MSAYVWIGLGGALGSMARFFVSGALARLCGETFPWGTVVVNVTGCFLIGLLATATGPEGRLRLAADPRQFLMVGVCGGYTTFSAFSLQTLDLLRDGEALAAAGNVTLSLTACMIAVWVGALAGQALNQLRA